MKQDLINKFITQGRLGKYRDIKEYRENLLFSNRFYIPLSVLEVALRNAIAQHLNKFYGNSWLLNESRFLQRDALSKIDDAKAKILKREEALTQDKLVAELPFGFWTSLFQKPYDCIMRTQTLKQIFPNLPPKNEQLIDRKYISSELNKIRKFRNRIFHHEKVINKLEFLKIEEDINRMLIFLDTELDIFVNELLDE
jgi:hypothetical protein